jgi:hypothetical protein
MDPTMPVSRKMNIRSMSSRIYRLRAVAAERRASQAIDSVVRMEWEELAIEWHFLANAIADAQGETSNIGD